MFVRKGSLFVLLLFISPSVFAQEQDMLVSFRDIPYVKGGTELQRLDLFVPAGYQNAKKPFPVFVSIHGGGWEGGNKSHL